MARDELRRPARGGDDAAPRARAPPGVRRAARGRRRAARSPRSGRGRAPASRPGPAHRAAAAAERRHQRVDAAPRVRRQQRVALAARTAASRSALVAASRKPHAASARGHGVAIVLPDVRPLRGRRLGEHRLEVARAPRRGAPAAARANSSQEAQPPMLRDARAVLRRPAAASCVCASSRYCRRCSSVAQEHVGRGELAHRGARAAALSRPGSASTCSVGRSGERRVAPAAHQLQRLRDELDLADAAGAELDVLGELAARDFAPHLGVQAAHRRRACRSRGTCGTRRAARCAASSSCAVRR